MAGINRGVKITYFPFSFQSSGSKSMLCSTMTWYRDFCCLLSCLSFTTFIIILLVLHTRDVYLQESDNIILTMRCMIHWDILYGDTVNETIYIRPLCFTLPSLVLKSKCVHT